MDQLHKNVVHDVYHQWLKWCRSHYVWDDSIKTHVGAVIRKFKNIPKSISKSNEIIIATINIRSVKDHLPVMIVDHPNPVVWCMQEISTPSPPTIPRSWKIFLNPRTGGDRHADGTGFAVDTNRIQATSCHDSGKQAVGDILGWTTRPNARRYQHLPFWNNDLRLLAQSVKQHRQRFGKLKRQGRFKTVYASKKNWQLAAKTLLKIHIRGKQLWYTNIREKWTHSNSQHVREAFQAIHRIGGGSTNSMIPHTKEVMNEEWSTILSSTPKNYSYDGNHWKTKVEELMKQESLGSISPIDCHELRNTLQKLSNHKSPGLDDISNETLKMIQHTKFEGALQNILNSTLQDPSKIPVEWKKSKAVLIPKEKQPSLLEYRQTYHSDQHYFQIARDHYMGSNQENTSQYANTKQTRHHIL